MTNYIPADKLKAEIERRLAAYQKNFDKADNKIARLSTDGRIASLKALLPFVDSLQQDEKPGERWQPCDEHFRALGYAIEYFKKKKNDTTHLEDLYNGLKKLS